LTLAEEIPTWAPDLQPLLFREPNPLFYEKSPWGPRTIRSRLHALAALTEGQQPGADEEARSRVPQILIATVRSCMTRTLPPRDFIANSRWLRQGRSLQLERLLRHLVDIGYQRETLVTAPGQFSRRGGILDLWPPAQSSPIRLDLFGEEIESLQSFDPASQRSSRQMEGVRVTPAREMLPKNYEQAWDRFQPPSDSPSGRLLLEFFLGWMHPAPSGLLDYLAPERQAAFWTT
jgi:transcription-repair coupling factor (superfamily II helicase)